MQSRACVLAVSLLALASVVMAQQQCPADSVTEENGQLIFAELSEGAGLVDATYDPGSLGAWNSLANGFVNAVRSGGLPYDLLIPVLNDTFISNSGQPIDPLGLLQSFAPWWAGILAVTLLGILVGVLFLIVGCCFWCCRCCGKCGGAKIQDTRERNDCFTFTFASILLLCSLVLFAAAVVAFFSNEQTFSSVDNIQSTLNSVVQDSSNYLRDTTQEIDEILCQAVGDDGVLLRVVGEISGIQESLQGTIDDLSVQLNRIVTQLNNSVVASINTVLTEVGPSVAGVTQSVGRIKTDLTTVTSDLTAAVTTCRQNAGMPGAPDCDPIMNVRDATSMAMGMIPDVPDVNSQLNDLEIAISGIGGNIQDGQNELMDALGPQAMERINSSLQEVTPFIDQAMNSLSLLGNQLSVIVDPIINTTFTASACPPLDGGEVFSRLVVPPVDLGSLFAIEGATVSTPPPPPVGDFLISLGYVNECLINAAFDYVRSFDVYRYAFGIVICSLTLITIALVWVGILLGLIGFRKDRYPYDRSNLSHCGGIILLISVGCTFIFGFILLLLSTIFFFLGSNAFKICQDIQGPDYPAFANTIDDPNVRAAFATSVPLLSSLPSVSGLLRDCEENNTALFAAANLNEIIASVLPEYAGSIEATLNQAFNLTALRGVVDTTISTVADNLNLNQGEITSAIETALSSIQNTSFDVNITSYPMELDNALATADLNNSISTLRGISGLLTLSNQGTEAAAINAAADLLENLRDVILVEVAAQLNDLQDTLKRVNAAAVTLQQNITAVAVDIGELVGNISGPILNTFINQTVRGSVDRSFGYVFDYIRHVDNQVMNNVGGCQPMYGVYTQIHNTICRNFLDGLNGFWWSLGFCSFLFVPVVIFAVLTSSFFLKKKSADGDNDGYLDYPMKSY
ncbi:prominin-1-like [Halichondria panicea]|uniref:prominin-1-like n=1 Tax=Halichondria panicea TaxID=6063 RepID=UPI00312B33DC